MHAFDRQTDRRTDRILIATPRLHSMQRGKNGSFFCIYFISKSRLILNQMLYTMLLIKHRHHLNVAHALVHIIDREKRDQNVCCNIFNKMISYRREIAQQGGLVMAQNKRLKVGDNINGHYKSIFNHCDGKAIA